MSKVKSARKVKSVSKVESVIVLNNTLRDLSVPEKAEILSIRHFLDDILNYNFSPPYQRGSNWKMDRKAKLIESIIYNRKIGPISVVRQSESQVSSNHNKYYVLDGKQRCEAIRDFAENKFPIVVQLSSSPLDRRQYYYDDIRRQKDSHGELATILDRFHKYNIDIVVYSHMSFEKQRELFEVTNYSMELRVNEKTFCTKYILCKKFYTFLFNEKIRPYLFSGDKGTKLDSYENGCRWAHDVGYMCFGQTMTAPTEDAQELTSRLADDRSIAPMEAKIRNAGIDSNDTFSNETIARVSDDMLGYFNLIEQSAKMLQATKDYRRLKGEWLKRHPKALQDFLIFYTRNLCNSKLTKAYINENLQAFSQALDIWVLRTKIPTMGARRLTKNSCHKGDVEDKFSLLDSLFDDTKAFLAELKEDADRHYSSKDTKDAEKNLIKKYYQYVDGKDFILGQFVFDMGKKGKKFTETEKLAAVICSDGRCPVTGADLTAQNTDIDHSKAACISSAAEPLAMNSSANRKLGGNSEEFLAKAINARTDSSKLFE